MPSPVVIALDAMGGDHAPWSVVDGANRACERHPDLRFLLFGDEARIRPVLSRYGRLQDVARIHHTSAAVASGDKPSQALRRGRDTSMRLAIDAVAAGEAAGVVSAGNTGALMAMSKFVLKTLPGIERPAIASFFPTLRGETVMLDLGANIDCDAQNLVQFAVMGAAFARVVLGLKLPTVALLNVGEEEGKGNESVRQAAQLLRETRVPMVFEGFVEGDGIPLGQVDVVVTDGFSGNVALKTAEGTAKLFAHYLRTAFQQSVMSKVGYMFAKESMDQLKARVDPRYYNGGVFLGLNGVSVKSHGASDGVACATAIGLAADMALGDLPGRISADLANCAELVSAPAPAVVGELT